MAAALVRPSILCLPAPSAGLIREWTRLRMGAKFVRTSSCALHTVVATEDPVRLPCFESGSILEQLNSGERYKHVIISGQHTFKGDLSEAWGASGTAPEPKDYAFAGLAMCSSMTIRLFADRKRWSLRRVTVTVKEIGKALHGTLPDALQVMVCLEGDLTDAQKSRLLEISANCPVKQMMLGKMRDGISVHLSPYP